VEGTYSVHSVHQAPMEPRAAVAERDAAGRLVVHASTQHPFGVRQQLVEALGLPHRDIRVVAETVGGGFGSKLEANVELYAALLARASGRPVRIYNSREEDLQAGNPRHPMRFVLRSAIAADGTILGREARVVMDSGAYAVGTPVLTGVAAMLIPGPYRIPNLKVEVQGVYTNNVPFGAYRGPTGPQCVYAIEAHTDAIARAIGRDPLEFRLLNILEDGDTGHSGQLLSSISLREVISRAADAIGVADDAGLGRLQRANERRWQRRRAHGRQRDRDGRGDGGRRPNRRRGAWRAARICPIRVGRH
jgi:CO/xanthine dehydrogenase Mo-binding subunit